MNTDNENLDNIVFALFNRKHDIVLYHFTIQIAVLFVQLMVHSEDATKELKIRSENNNSRAASVS